MTELLMKLGPLKDGAAAAYKTQIRELKTQMAATSKHLNKLAILPIQKINVDETKEVCVASQQYIDRARVLQQHTKPLIKQ
jgi:hypothetical protein